MVEKTTAQMRRSTREYIEAESRANESVDDTIRRLLEINASETNEFERLTAYLSDDQTEQVRQAKEVIEDEVDVTLDYEENGGTGYNPILLFRAESNGVPIAEIETTEENAYSVRYRSGVDDMAAVAGYTTNSTAIDEWEDDLRRKVRGAYTTHG
jgi:inosine/xanthosine triphosphate pyrophosphatase family protein